MKHGQRSLRIKAGDFLPNNNTEYVKIILYFDNSSEWRVIINNGVEDIAQMTV